MHEIICKIGRKPAAPAIALLCDILTVQRSGRLCREIVALCDRKVTSCDRPGADASGISSVHTLKSYRDHKF